MVDDPPEPQGGEISTTPRANGSPGFSFHLRDTELLVTVFPGCRTRFFLRSRRVTPQLRVSLSFSSSILSPCPLRSLLRFRLVLSFSFSPTSFSHALWSRAQSPISNDYARRSPQVDPTATHEREKPIGTIKRIDSRRCKDRSFPPPSPLFDIDLFISSMLAKVKWWITRRNIASARGRANELPICGPLSAFQRLTKISQEARITP